ncbi:hypothetical protein ES705_50590 [subsurface metagenome]
MLSVPYALHAKTVTSFSESDPKIGTITTNYLSKWDGSSLVTSSIFDNGNVGIGTTGPGAKLSLKAGNETDSDLLSFDDGVNKIFTFQGLFSGAGAGGNYLNLRDLWGNDVMTWRNGNVGIGTTSPDNGKLEVNGEISTGHEGLRWKLFSGYTAGTTVTLTHGLAASKNLFN